MLDFKPLSLAGKNHHELLLRQSSERGCEYTFVNLFLWGRQSVTHCHGHLVFFCQFNRRSVYLFPLGSGDKKPVLDAIIDDARERGIPCRLVGLTHDDCALLEKLYPGQLRYHWDRDSFDYVYDINDLAELSGRKFQRKRNHLNKFRQQYPDHQFAPICAENVSLFQNLAEQWYALRGQADPHADFQMEKAALTKALRNWQELELQGLLLSVDGQPVAMTLGSHLREDTFDIHFEKALDTVDGAYAAINNGFARYLREKYPEVLYLNREDDLGLEGLRKAKLSYCPHHMIEKSWACLLEDCYDY